MIFHENRLLANNSQCNIIPYFCQKLGKMSQNLSIAAVVIGALRFNLIKQMQDLVIILLLSHDNYNV